MVLSRALGTGRAGTEPPAPRCRGEAAVFSLLGTFLCAAKINRGLLMELLFLTSISQECHSSQVAAEDGKGIGMEGPSGWRGLDNSGQDLPGFGAQDFHLRC